MQDRDDCLLATSDGLDDIRRDDDRHIRLTASHHLTRFFDVGQSPDQFGLRAEGSRQLLAAFGDPRVGGCHDHGPQNRGIRVEPDSKQKQDEERSEHQGYEKSRLAEDLKGVLLEEGHCPHEPALDPLHPLRHRLASSSGSSLVTSSTKTSSKGGKKGSTDSTPISFAFAQSVMSATTSPASSTINRYSPGHRAAPTAWPWLPRPVG